MRLLGFGAQARAGSTRRCGGLSSPACGTPAGRGRARGHRDEAGLARGAEGSARGHSGQVRGQGCAPSGKRGWVGSLVWWEDGWVRRAVSLRPAEWSERRIQERTATHCVAASHAPSHWAIRYLDSCLAQSTWRGAAATAATHVVTAQDPTPHARSVDGARLVRALTPPVRGVSPLIRASSCLCYLMWLRRRRCQGRLPRTHCAPLTSLQIPPTTCDLAFVSVRLLRLRRAFGRVMRLLFSQFAADDNVSVIKSGKRSRVSAKASRSLRLRVAGFLRMLDEYDVLPALLSREDAVRIFKKSASRGLRPQQGSAGAGTTVYIDTYHARPGPRMDHPGADGDGALVCVCAQHGRVDPLGGWWRRISAAMQVADPPPRTPRQI